MNCKGTLFVLNRGLHQSIEQLEPQRKTLVNKNNGDPLDCLGSILNDMTADSKGGVYFTMGGVFHADSKGKITKYGENVNPNGIVLSPDEKHLYVTNGATLAAFDVQKDGSLTNQREFAKLEAGGGGDGSTFDSAGRLYVTAQAAGMQVFDPDGKYLGVIPTPAAGHQRDLQRPGSKDAVCGVQNRQYGLDHRHPDDRPRPEGPRQVASASGETLETCQHSSGSPANHPGSLTEPVSPWCPGFMGTPCRA